MKHPTMRRNTALLPDLWSVEIIGQQKTQYNEAPDQKEDIILK